jgi:hypothetical protein
MCVCLATLCVCSVCVVSGCAPHSNMFCNSRGFLVLCISVYNEQSHKCCGRRIMSLCDAECLWLDLWVPLLNNLHAGLWRRTPHVCVLFLSTARVVAHAHYGRQDNDWARAWLADGMLTLANMSRARVLDAFRELRMRVTSNVPLHACPGTFPLPDSTNCRT